MASVIGLAPIKPDLKGRLRKLLCIHGLFKTQISGANFHFSPTGRLSRVAFAARLRDEFTESLLTGRR